jgi:hypothetical protein
MANLKHMVYPRVKGTIRVAAITLACLIASSFSANLASAQYYFVPGYGYVDARYYAYLQQLQRQQLYQQQLYQQYLQQQAAGQGYGRGYGTGGSNGYASGGSSGYMSSGSSGGYSGGGSSSSCDWSTGACSAK